MGKPTSPSLRAEAARGGRGTAEQTSGTGLTGGYVPPAQPRAIRISTRPRDGLGRDFLVFVILVSLPAHLPELG